jgi:shikimate dehydrogenase
VPSSLIFGLIGHPVGHSLSPTLHKAALAYCGQNGEYRLIDIGPGELPHKLPALIADGLSGFNVTIPHKQELFRMVSTRTAEASLVGAVNVVKVADDGNLIGHNTDYPGLKAAIVDGLSQPDLAKKRVLILGAGGSALAAACAVRDLNVSQVDIFARDQIKQKAFIDAIAKRLPIQIGANASKSFAIVGYEPGFAGHLDMVINATAIGLNDDPAPGWIMDLLRELPDHCFCFDLVYRKDRQLPTFARLASERGLNSVDGIEMLVHQARLSFEYWTGKLVPYESMKAALSEPK